MTDLLSKSILQKELTPDTISAQFCSSWLQGQISDLFTKISLMEEKLNASQLLLEESTTGRILLFEQLQEAKEDALRFGRAMESERNEKHFLSVELEIVRDDRNKLRDGIISISKDFSDLTQGWYNNGDFYESSVTSISNTLEDLKNV